MGLLVDRSSVAYKASIVLAVVAAIGVTAITWATKPAAAWIYSLHPTFMSIAFVLMLVGTLENAIVYKNAGSANAGDSNNVSSESPTTPDSAVVGQSAAGQGSANSSAETSNTRQRLGGSRERLDAGATTVYEQRRFCFRNFHVWCMVAATASFALGWLFMFIQHRKTGSSHFASKSPVTHKLHVYGGYLVLALVLVQAAGGVVKNRNWPAKSVKWHGVLARVILGLVFLWVLVFASWAGLHIAKKDESGFAAYITEILFSVLFVATGVVLFYTLSKGTRPPDSEKIGAAEERQPLRNLGLSAI